HHSRVITAELPVVPLCEAERQGVTYSGQPSDLLGRVAAVDAVVPHHVAEVVRLNVLVPEQERVAQAVGDIRKLEPCEQGDVESPPVPLDVAEGNRIVGTGPQETPARVLERLGKLGRRPT